MTLKIGLIREYKQPADRRVVLTPLQAKQAMEAHEGLKICVEPSPDRIFKDEEYAQMGVEVSVDMSTCDVLLGVKEVPVNKLIAHKTYLFFAHVIKEQAYNQNLMRALIKNANTLIDYEMLINAEGKRVIGFGAHAGIAGAYNGLLTWGKKHRVFDLPPAYTLPGYEAMIEVLKLQFQGTLNMVLTGTGRVSEGAQQLLNDIGIQRVSPQAFLEHTFAESVYTVLGIEDLYILHPEKPFDLMHFLANSHLYSSRFARFLPRTDLLINGMYWDEKSPRLFAKDDINKPYFKPTVIADISCDVEGSVPVTYKATDMYDPVYGIDRITLEMTAPYLPHTLDIMAVTNLPSELAADASEHFGRQFLTHVLPGLMQPKAPPIITRATICSGGALTPAFSYLSNYAYGAD